MACTSAGHADVVAKSTGVPGGLCGHADMAMPLSAVGAAAGGGGGGGGGIVLRRRVAALGTVDPWWWVRRLASRLSLVGARRWGVRSSLRAVARCLRRWVCQEGSCTLVPFVVWWAVWIWSAVAWVERSRPHRGGAMGTLAGCLSQDA